MTGARVADAAGARTTEAATRRTAYPVGCLVGFAAFVVYVATLAPAPYLLDSAELAAASFGLGVAHPPGEPLALLLGRLASLLPLGSVAFRVGLAQAVAGAVAVGLVFRMTVDLGRALVPTGPGETTRALVGGAAALGFGLAPGAILSANRPEVYALATALALGALHLAQLTHQARGDARSALLAALLIGLGLSNHPLIAGLCAVAAALAALPLLRAAAGLSRARLIAASCAALGVGLLVLGYLPVRAVVLAQPGHGGDIAWGDGRTLAGLGWLLSAQTFVAKTSVVHTSADPGAWPFVFIEELGPVLALLAVAGALFSLRARGTRLLGATLLVALAASSAAALQAGFDAQNPDIRGYLGVALAAAAVLAGMGALPLLAVARKTRPAIVGSVALLAAVALHAFPIPTGLNLHDRTSAARVAADLLDQLPPRAVLASSHFETAFLVAYQRGVEGARPDLAVVHLGFVRGPGYAARLVLDEPALAPLVAAHADFALTPAELAPLSRAIAFEPDDHLTPALQATLRPVGSLWRFVPQATTLERPAPLPAAVLVEAAADRSLRGFVAYRSFRDAAFACARGLRLTARLRLSEVAALIPQDARLRELSRRCE